MSSKQKDAGSGASAPEPAYAPAAEATGTVCVALNSPKSIAFLLPNGKRLAINGGAAHLARKEMSVLPGRGAYGLTIVPKADWEYVEKTYGGMAIFKSGLCFAASTMAEAELEAKSNCSNIANGYEPVDAAGA